MMDHRASMLVTYLEKFSPTKIITSYTCSTLCLNQNIDPQKIDKLQETVMTLCQAKFFNTLGNYSQNLPLINGIFDLLNDINNLDEHNSEMYMTSTTAKNLDNFFSTVDGSSRTHTHEATFLLMQGEVEIARNFKGSFNKFLQMFNFKRKDVINILSETVIDFLKRARSIDRLHFPTLQIGSYEESILAKDCDEFLHKRWFLPKNSYLESIKSLENSFQRRFMFMSDETCVSDNEENTDLIVSRLGGSSVYLYEYKKPGLPFEKSGEMGKEKKENFGSKKN